ncbi:PREDICTED: uncharacterized protein LOC107346460, partial [Paramuricea clavata]
MAEELKKLVKIRGGHRASLTKTLAVTEELLTQSTEIFEETQASDFEIKLTQQRVILGEKLPLLKSFDDKIILLVEDGNIEDEVASADDIRQAIQRAIVHIDLILEKLKKKWNKDSGSSPSNLESSLSQATVPHTSNSTVKPNPPEQEASHQPTPSEEHPRMQPQGHQPTNQSREQPQNTHVNMFVDAQSSILLQTARAPIYNPKDPSKTLQARLIFDSGSQRSYITSTIRDKLNLPIVRRDTLKINAFGSKDEDITSCDMVQFQLDTERGHKLNLSAYVVPLICSTIGNQNTRFAQQSYEHLSGALQTWLNGPQWMLKDIESEGVEGKNNEECPEECITEMKANDRKAFQNTCLLVCTETSYQIQSIIDVRRFSSYQKLITVTSMVLRFIRRVKKAHLRAEENKNSEAEIAEIL